MKDQYGTARLSNLDVAKFRDYAQIKNHNGTPSALAAWTAMGETNTAEAVLGNTKPGNLTKTCKVICPGVTSGSGNAEV